MKRIIEFYLDGQRSYFTKRKGPVRAPLGRVGLLWNWRAGWVGVHHSAKDRRTCINLLPFLTIWYTRPGGMLP